jgi:archaellum biogenesis ATPase FlaH
VFIKDYLIRSSFQINTALIIVVADLKNLTDQCELIILTLHRTSLLDVVLLLMIDDVDI